jgi:hypothetical protein
MLKKEEERVVKLKRKTIIDPITGCWLWQNHTDRDGYGKVKYLGQMYGIHRLSAYLYLDLNLFDRTQYALHKDICPNKNCWNPEHLYVGTAHENVRDSLVKGTHMTIHYPRKIHT